MGYLRRVLDWAWRYIGFRDLWDAASWGSSLIGASALLSAIWESWPTELRIVALLGLVLILAPLFGVLISCLRRLPKIILPERIDMSATRYSRGPIPGYHLTVPLDRLRNASDRPVSIEIALRIYHPLGRKQDLYVDQMAYPTLHRTLDIPATTTLHDMRLVFWLSAIHIAWIRFVPERGGTEGFRLQLIVKDIDVNRVVKVQGIRSISLDSTLGGD